MTRKPADFIPVRDFPDGHQHNGKQRCQAWSPPNGRQCMGLAMGNGKCRVHGGNANSGIAHQNYKTGKYSKVLPKRFLENYDTARHDPEYLKLQDDIALIDARLVELTASIDGKASSAIFNSLASAVDQIEKAQSTIVRARNIQDEEQRAKVTNKANVDFLEAINETARLVKSGSKEWYIWHDITDLIEKRRRLVETERRLLVDMQLLIHAQEVTVLLDAIMESVRINVPDRGARQAIQKEFLRLTA